MNRTIRRAASAAALLCLGTLLARAAAPPSAEPRVAPGDELDPALARARLAEELVRSERTAILLGELAASEAPRDEVER